MATLSASLNTTANKLIEKYGNTITLTNNTASGGYDPTTGAYTTNNSSDIVVKASETPITIDTLRLAGIEETAYGAISSIYTIPYDATYASIDNTWTVNSNRIHKVVTTKAQDTNIVIKLFVG